MSSQYGTWNRLVTHVIKRSLYCLVNLVYFIWFIWSNIHEYMYVFPKSHRSCSNRNLFTTITKTLAFKNLTFYCNKETTLIYISMNWIVNTCIRPIYWQECTFKVSKRWELTENKASWFEVIQSCLNHHYTPQ